MLIPMTSGSALAALALAALLLGIWALPFKANPKWRFEIFYIDVSIGSVVGAILLAFTLGNMGSQNTFTFEDNLTVSGKRQMATAVAAGIVFNLGNILTFAGVPLGGLNVAMHAGIGSAVFLSAIWIYAVKRDANAALLFGGAFLVLASVLLLAAAIRGIKNPGQKKSALAPMLKGWILSTAGGLILAASRPIAAASMETDLGLGPYSVAVFASLGVLLSSLLYVLYFVNLPVAGQPISLLSYFKAGGKQHLFGLISGTLLAGAAAAALAGSAGTGAAAVRGPEGIAGIGAGAIVAAVAGIASKERSAWTGKAKTLGFASLLGLAAGLVLLGLSA